MKILDLFPFNIEKKQRIIHLSYGEMYENTLCLKHTLFAEKWLQLDANKRPLLHAIIEK
jgi:hypothetical protein